MDTMVQLSEKAIHSGFIVGCTLALVHLEVESVLLFPSHINHVCWGLNFLIHISVANILCAAGVHYCFVIIINIISICIDNFVDMGAGTIFDWGTE